MTLRNRDINEVMRRYMPEFYEEFPQIQEEIAAESTELTDLFSQIRDVLAQFYVDRATWGIPIWEREVGITPDNSRPLSRRRTEIKSRLRGFGVITHAKLDDILDNYDESIGYAVDNPQYEVTFTFPIEVAAKEVEHYSVADFRVGYRLTEYINEPPVNMAEFQEELRKLLPAHLAMSISVVSPENTIEFVDDPSAIVTEYRTVDEFKVGVAAAKDIQEVGI
ncbi:DUF2313 domain-containing protein [Salibacterium salarium]|uniref:DUF2313 domain-containing protein n=1 Tax=Salibacterium salarium TaxID=284579 RepID=A0A3R9QF37_9BACI|nr:putative phage tail protein [Salibacterium salarium]RSL28990.1 DUF2313 domain-containing protein [Salibacterium salarium]